MADINNKEVIKQCIEAFAGLEMRNYIQTIRSASGASFTYYVPRPEALIRVLEIGREAVPYLTELLRRSNEEIRMAALRSLWEITSKHYGFEDVTDFSCTAIVTARWPDIIESWQRWWDANKGRSEFEWLSEQIKNGSPSDKYSAVRRFGELGDKRAIWLKRSRIRTSVETVSTTKIFTLPLHDSAMGMPFRTLSMCCSLMTWSPIGPRDCDF